MCPLARTVPPTLGRSQYILARSIVRQGGRKAGMNDGGMPFICYTQNTAIAKQIHMI